MSQGKAIVMTPPGTSALAVVRLVDADAFLRQHFDRVPDVGKLAHGDWVIDGDVLDDPLVVNAGDALEIHLHGGTRIVRRFLDDAARAGLEVIDTRSALRQARERIHEVRTQADVASLLPLARSDEAVAALLAQPVAWESGESADASDPTLRLLLDGVTVALVGRPNAGKSTLANRLFGQAGSLVSDVPGTTRDWVGHAAVLGGLPVRLVDTPGQRRSGDAIEQQAIAMSLPVIKSADVVVLVRDATRPGETWDGGVDVVVWNKCDLAEATGPGIALSAETGQGVDALIGAVHACVGVKLDDLQRPLSLACPATR